MVIKSIIISIKNAMIVVTSKKKIWNCINYIYLMK